MLYFLVFERESNNKNVYIILKFIIKSKIYKVFCFQLTYNE